MDKLDYIYILAVALTVIFAVTWNYGSFSSNVEQTNLINQTLLNLHEDRAREQQTKHEDEARENQSTKIRAEIQQQLDTLTKKIEKMIIRENNTTQKTYEDNHKILKNQETVMKQHEKVAIDHDAIQNDVRNTTLSNNEMLKEVLNYTKKIYETFKNK